MENFVQSAKSAVERLKLSEYWERIFNSSSRGELWFLEKYIRLNAAVKDDDIDEIKGFFDVAIKEIEETWERPESMWQHPEKMIVLGMSKK